MPGDVDGDGLVSDQGAERIPALIAAVADSGLAGYVRLSDLEGVVPASPEEALEAQDEIRTIPVYAADGETVIGELTESAGEPIELDAADVPAEAP